MIGALDALQFVAIKLLPHGKFCRIDRKRPAFRRLQRPVATAPPCSADCIARSPELVPLSSTTCSHMVERKQRVNHHLAIAILEPETIRIAKCLFAMVRPSPASLETRHVHAV